jgi:hypothetical protein
LPEAAATVRKSIASANNLEAGSYPLGNRSRMILQPIKVRKPRRGNTINTEEKKKN